MSIMLQSPVNASKWILSCTVEKLDAITNKDEQLQFAIDYVQNHVYYVFNADEMNGHKPQEPSITYQNKQGDCKAKCVLLKVILGFNSNNNRRTEYLIFNFYYTLTMILHIKIHLTNN